MLLLRPRPAYTTGMSRLIHRTVTIVLTERWTLTWIHSAPEDESEARYIGGPGEMSAPVQLQKTVTWEVIVTTTKTARQD